MELWLLRHAKAETMSTSGRDQDRKLSEAGLAACDRLNTWLATHIKAHQAPQTILFSPATRTQQTIDKVTRGLPVATPQAVEGLWAATTGDLVAIITQRADDPGPLWLIGHNPGLSDLVGWLAQPLPPPGMKPGTLVRLAIEMPLHPGVGEILEVVQPNA